MKKNSLILLFAIFILNQIIVAQSGLNAPQEAYEFKFTTWNTEWLSCSQYGPTDEELQINNVVAVIKAINPDVLALQEVGTSDLYTTIDTLVRRLGVAWGGMMVYSSKDNCGQNQGFIYKKSKIELVNATYITNGGSSYDWSSGRYPVLYNINLLAGGTSIPVSFINIHAKAMGDESSYLRRKNASIGLKALLDGSGYNTKRVVILGDLNDYLVGTQCSSCSPDESPYKNFMDDTQNYKGLTNLLIDPAYGNNPVIDNIIISNELVEDYKVNSTRRETLATQGIANYNNTTSDHVPVSATFTIGSTGGSTCESLAISETFAESLGNYTPYSVSGLQSWGWRSNYGAVMSGYANLVNNANEDWLISPVYDLSIRSSATLTFNHAINFAATENDKIMNHTLWASVNYSNGTLPSNASWTQLTIPTMASGSSWTFVNSGNISIPTQLLQKDVRFAFKYQSNSTAASTWEIKELNLNAACVNTNITDITEISQSKISVVGKRIKIENKQPLSVSVVDITGRVLFSVKPIQIVEIPVLQSGIYIIRTGNKANKVVVE